eukprot:scaffold244559_cov18-Prasinocladus_malaysianus.AAC.1
MARAWQIIWLAWLAAYREIDVHKPTSKNLERQAQLSTFGHICSISISRSGIQQGDFQEQKIYGFLGYYRILVPGTNDDH